MTGFLARISRPCVLALLVLIPTVQAAPLGLVLESGITARFAYSFSSNQAFSIALEYETPIAVPIPIDVSIAPRIGYNFSAGGFDAGIMAKAVIFPSIVGGLMGVGIWVDVDVRNFGSTLNTFKTAFGPFLNFNLDQQLYATLSASLFSLTNGIYAFDLGLAARYYLDIFAFELSIDYNTIGMARASFGLRFSL
jgi:hypothetical protein